MSSPPMRRAVLALSLAALVLAAFDAGALTLAGPAYPPPGGATLSDSGTDAGGQQARTGGRTFTYTGLATGTYGLYFGAIPTMVKSGFGASGSGATMGYAGTPTDLANGRVIWAGATTWTRAVYCVGCQSYSNTTVYLRATMDVTTVGGAPLGLSDASAPPYSLPPTVGGILPVTGDFKVKLLFEASFLSTGPWTPAIEFWNANNTIAGYGTLGTASYPGHAANTSFDGGFWSFARPTASVSGGGSFCEGSANTTAPAVVALTGLGPWNIHWSDGVDTNGVTANPYSRYPSSAGVYSVTALSDANGDGVGTYPGSATVTMIGALGATGAVTGPAGVCYGASGAAYSTTAVTNATTYTWSVPAGATILSGQGTNSITVDWGTATSGEVSVVPSNSCFTGTAASAAVTVYEGLGSTGAVTGPASVCFGATGASYSTDAVTNATTYTWSVPAGATILSGQGTDSITVNWGTGASGDVTVVPSNPCFTGDAADLAVAVGGSIALTGSSSVCLDTLGGTATVTPPTGGSVVMQWGYRTTPGGPVTDLPGRTGPTYVIQGADFPAAGTYSLVCRIVSASCGKLVSNEAAVTVTDACGSPVADPVQILTLTTRNAAGTNVLQWVNPASGASGLRIRARSDGTYPTDPADGFSVFLGSAGAGTKATVTDSSVANGTTYLYSAFTCTVGDCSSGVSAGKVVNGRPFNAPAKVKWAYSTGGIATNPPGLRTGTGAAVLSVSNDRYVHSMVAGPAGGAWPATWTPLGMNAPSQGRAIPITLKTSNVGGVKTVLFVASQDGRVYAVNSETGALLWASAVLGETLQASPSAMFTDFGGVANRVFIGTRNSAGNNVFYALNAADGSVVWSFDNGGGANAIGIISGQAAVDYTGKRVYFSSREHPTGSSDTVWALSITGASTFTKAWSAAVGDVDSSVSFSNATVYVGDNDGEVHALVPASGANKWLSPFATGDGAVKGTVWPSGGKVYVSTDTRVWAINDLGLNTTPTAYFASPISAVPNPSTPMVIGTNLYVGGGDGTLYEYVIGVTPPAPKTVALGDPANPFLLGRPTADGTNKLLYVGTESGHVYAVAYPF